MKMVGWVMGFATVGLLAGCSAEAVDSMPMDGEGVGARTEPLLPAFIAFVLADKTSGSFTPSTEGSYSSTRQAQKVTWLSTGRARIDLTGFDDAPGGNVLVGAYGDSNARCKVENWSVGSAPDALSIYVRCHTPSGAAVSVPFIASYVASTTAGAYVWADKPTTASYAPNGRYSFNQFGQNQVRRLGTGRYEVEMGGIPLMGGNVQVTAYGTDADYCNVVDWLKGDDSTTAEIRCFDTTGARDDSAFSMRFVTMDGGYPLEMGYSWANEPLGQYYVPNKTYQDYASCTWPNSEPQCIRGFDNLADRASKGVQVFDYPDTGGSPRAAFVTAYGTDPNYCHVWYWYDLGSTAVDVIHCYDEHGELVDTQLTEQHLVRQ